jgi:hypothetical protein
VGSSPTSGTGASNTRARPGVETPRAGAPRVASSGKELRPMHRLSIALAVLVASLAAIALPASAQTREFTGKVDKINKSEVIVDNRMGDKVKFEKLDSTTVEGEKKDWKNVKKNDWVTVHWKMIDKPRKAYKVVVLPPRAEAGEEVE